MSNLTRSKNIYLIDEELSLRRDARERYGVEKNPDDAAIDALRDLSREQQSIILPDGYTLLDVARTENTCPAKFNAAAIVTNAPAGEITPVEVLMRLDRGSEEKRQDRLASSLNILSIMRALREERLRPALISAGAIHDEEELLREGLATGLIDGILPPMSFSQFHDFLSRDFAQLVAAHSNNSDDAMSLKFLDCPLLTAKEGAESVLINSIPDEKIRLAVMRLRQRTRRTLLFDSTVLKNDEKRRFAEIIAAVQPKINHLERSI